MTDSKSPRHFMWSKEELVKSLGERKLKQLTFPVELIREADPISERLILSEDPISLGLIPPGSDPPLEIREPNRKEIPEKANSSDGSIDKYTHSKHNNVATPEKKCCCCFIL